jgi:hypothetical protein
VPDGWFREELLDPEGGTLDGGIVKEHDGILTRLRSPRNKVAHYIPIEGAPSMWRRSIDRSENRLSASLRVERISVEPSVSRALRSATASNTSSPSKPD